MPGRDLILFDVITALGITHFLLKTKGTPLEMVTIMFTLMWVMSMVILVMLRVYGGRSGQTGDVVDYDENLERQHLPWLFGSLAAIAVINILLVSGLRGAVRFSAIYVPRPSLAQVPGTFSGTATILDDLLYNFFLVSQAEESVKLMSILALYRKTQNFMLSAGIPIGIWAVFHAYLAYLGQGMEVLVIAAFISGIVLFIALRQTKSLLNAVISHGLWNSIVILSSLFLS